MTRLYGVIGSPIAHSFSPALHHAALRALRLHAVYSAFEVPPKFLAPMLRAFVLAGVEGLNVTVPLKESILPLLDRLDPTARAIGAVNTVVVHTRKTVGYNTDGRGFLLALQELGWRPRATHAVLLGAGGAARAVAWELSRWPGAHVTIANRHVARARRLAAWLAQLRPKATIEAVPLAAVRLNAAQLVVNATTVGMRAADPSPIDPAALRRGTLVYDLIYHRDTALVHAARRRGCLAAGGLSMLLYQGAESFRLWFDRPAPLAAMRRALNAALRP